MREKCFLHVVQKCFLHAGKMFFTASSGARRKPLRGAGRSTPCGRRHALIGRPHGLRPRANGLPAGRPAGENGNALRAKIVPRNQDHGRTAGGGKSCTAIKSHGWTVLLARAGSRSCCPCRCCLLLLLRRAPAPALAAEPGSCLGLSALPVPIRAARGPRPTGTGGWGKADMGRPLRPAA